jgi:large subunit ribosomal protein L6
MSRLGKIIILIPAGTTVRAEGQTIIAKGPKGELKYIAHDDVEVIIDSSSITTKPRFETKRANMMWGTTRAQINNIVTGVSVGFAKKLEITGVGYKANVNGKILELALGYSHPVNYAIPADITVITPKPTEILISGIDRQKVGQVAAEIRGFRGPEPYKGKGVKYEGEFIFRKEGKKK